MNEEHKDKALKRIRFLWRHYANLLSVVIAGPLLLIPNPVWVIGIVLVVVPVLYALMTSSGGRPSANSRCSLLANWSIVLLLFMAIVGMIISDDPAKGLPKLLGLLYAAAVYFAVRRFVVDFERAKKVAALLSMVCFVIALVGLFGTEWESKYTKTTLVTQVYEFLPQLIRDVPSSHQVVAGFHPNEVSGTLAPLIPIAAGVLVMALGQPLGKGRSRRLLAAVAATSLLLGITYVFLSVSRTAWLSLALACSIIAVTALLRRSARLVVFLVILFALMVFAVWQLHDNQVAYFFSDTDLFLQQDPSTWGQPTRPLTWQRALQMIGDHPVTGIGLNMFPYVVQAQYPFEYFNDFFVPHAHNLYLQTAVDYGLPGLSSMLLLLSASFSGVIRALRSRLVPGGLAWGILGALLSIVIFGILDAVAVGAKPSFLYFAVMALSIAVGETREEEQPATFPPGGQTTALSEQSPSQGQPG